MRSLSLDPWVRVRRAANQALAAPESRAKPWVKGHTVRKGEREGASVQVRLRRMLRGDSVYCVWLCRRVQECARESAAPAPTGWGPSEVGKGNLGGLTCPTRRALDAEATLSAS